VTSNFLQRDIDDNKKVGYSFHPSISLNSITYRGDYSDPNSLFKAVCSILEDRPDSCSDNDILGSSKPTQASFERAEAKAEAKMWQDYAKEQMELRGMERRASLFHIILGLMAVGLFIFASVLYCKIFNKKKHEDKMKVVVEDKVAEYFSLA